jgi:hypothetical protein
MYENEKIRHGKAILGMGRRKIKANDGEDEFNCDRRVFVNVTVNLH